MRAILMKHQESVILVIMMRMIKGSKFIIYLYCVDTLFDLLLQVVCLNMKKKGSGE